MKRMVLMTFLLFFVLIGSRVVMGQNSTARFKMAEVAGVKVLR